MRHAVIYVPGLGDHRSRNQQIIVGLWQLYGIRSEVVLMHWRTLEPFETKLARLLERIDYWHGEGYQVSLVGVSAGASAAINALAVRQDVIHRVVCVCGKLRSPETISPGTYATNPAFKESLQLLPGSLLGLDADKLPDILSIKPHADGAVPPQDTIILGAISRTIPTSGHVFSIATAITFYSWTIVQFIKKA